MTIPPVAKFVVESELPRTPELLRQLRIQAESGDQSERQQQVRADQEQIDRLMRDWMAVSREDGLNDAEVEEYMSRSWDYLSDIADKRQVMTERPIETTFQGQALPVIRRVIQDDPSVNSLVEIGTYYGYICHTLAKEFPHLTVTGVDFPRNLLEVNAEFKEPNVRFKSGYALRLLEAGELAGHLFFMCSTACRIKHKELRRYITALRAVGAKYVVFNEPIITLPIDELLHPDDTPIDRSIPVYYKGSKPGLPPCFLHNYKGVCEDMGMTVPHYRIYIPSFTVHPNYRIEMVAKF